MGIELDNARTEVRINVPVPKETHKNIGVAALASDMTKTAWVVEILNREAQAAATAHYAEERRKEEQERLRVEQEEAARLRAEQERLSAKASEPEADQVHSAAVGG